MIFGRKISNGSSRDVYEYLPDPTKVIKIEMDAGSFQNIIEATIWRELAETKFAKYFAPVRYLSDNGLYLVQDRCDVINDKRRMPEKLPHFMTDRKMQNYGLLDGGIVCFDYGTMVLTQGFTERMTKANWWGDNYSE